MIPSKLQTLKLPLTLYGRPNVFYMNVSRVVVNQALHADTCEYSMVITRLDRNSYDYVSSYGTRVIGTKLNRNLKYLLEEIKRGNLRTTPFLTGKSCQEEQTFKQQ